MIKTSKVKSVQANGTWEGKFGLMYKSEVSFDNGDCGEYSSKSREQNKFVEGVETEYEFIGGDFPKVKPVYNKPDFVSGSSNGKPTKEYWEEREKKNKDYYADRNDNKQLNICRQSSLKAAVDYCSSGNCSPSDVIKVAQEFVDWVMDDKKPNENNEMPF
jgi:AAA15 family ATPase/GTPase